MGQSSKVSSQQLGRDLFDDFVLRAQEAAPGAIEKFAKQFDVDVDVFRKEELYLRIFLVHFFTTFALRENPRKDEVLQAFRAQIRTRLDQQTVDTVLERRFPAYVASLRHSHPEYGASWPVAKAFAGFCGAGDDAAIIYYGSRLYGSTMKIVEFLGSLDVQ